jgi:hypothetical protein
MSLMGTLAKIAVGVVAAKGDWAMFWSATTPVAHPDAGLGRVASTRLKCRGNAFIRCFWFAHAGFPLQPT